METPYSRINEIKEASSQEGANDLLKQGFILVKVMERYSSDAEKQATNIVYVLGRQKSNGGSRAAPEQNGHPPNTLPPASTTDSTLLEKLPWKEYTNGSGEWAFYMDRDGALLPELEGIRRSHREAEVGGGADRGQLHLQDQGQVPEEVRGPRSAAVEGGEVLRVSQRSASGSCPTGQRCGRKGLIPAHPGESARTPSSRR